MTNESVLEVIYFFNFLMIVSCMLVNLLRGFFGLFFKKYQKFDFVTQFLRNGSTKLQSFVYHFVANFILFQKILRDFSRFCLWKAIQRLQATPAKWPIYLSSTVIGLRRNCSYLYTFRFILSPPDHI